MFYRYKVKRRYFYQKTLLKILTVTVTRSSLRNFIIFYHSLALKLPLLLEFF